MLAEDARAVAIAVAALTVVAFVLRVVLVRDSLFGDELFMLRIVQHGSLGDMLSVVRHTEKTPPLFFILVWLFAKVGDPVPWLRVASLAFGTALVPLGYLLGARTVGRSAGLLAAAILALDPFAIFYGSEGRAYAAIAFLAALSTLLLLRALDTNERRWWVAYGLAVVAAIYTHYVVFFVLIVQTAWALWTRRDRIRELLVVNGLVVLAFAPWIPSYLLQQRHSDREARGIATFDPPSLRHFGDINVKLLFGHPGSDLGALPGHAAIVVALCAIGASLAVAAVRAFRRRRAGGPPSLRLSSPVALLVLLALASAIGIGLLTLRPHMSWLLPRNLSPSLVPASVVVAALLVSLGRRASLPAVAAVLVVLVIGAVDSVDRENRRPDYRAAAHFIDARARPGEPVIQVSFLPPTGAPDDVLLVNFAHTHPLFRGAIGLDSPVWKLGERSGRLFLVLPLPGPLKSSKHPPPREGPGLRFRLVDERRYPGFQDLLVGEYASG